MARKALAAYQKGDYDAAHRLFWQAWTLDRRRGAWAYSAARAAHKLGRFEQAVRGYRAFLRVPRGATAKLPLARSYLAAAEDELVQALTLRAQRAAAPALGFRHARAAAAIHPRDPALWFQAGELADRAKLQAAAIACYRRVVALAPASSTEALVARQRLAALRGTPAAGAPGAVTPATARPPVSTARPAAPSVRRPRPTAPSVHRSRATLVLPLAIASVLSGATGALLLAGAADAADTLRARTTARVDRGELPSLSWSEANTEADRVRDRRLLGWTAAGIGSVGLAAAAWMLWAREASGVDAAALISICPGGAVLGWKARW